MSKKLNPKLIISKYFDSLIQHVDILTEEQLQIYSDSASLTIPANVEQQTLNYFKCKTNTGELSHDELSFENIDDLWKDGHEPNWNSLFMENFNERNVLSNVCIPENDVKINVRDYLNRARDEILAELGKGQEEAFKRYEMIKNDLKNDIDDEDNLMARLFADKFYILVEFEKSCSTEIRPKSKHLLILDFYLNKKDQEFFRYFFLS